MRVLAAMSGGVDSAVAAALTLRQGHEVLGITMVVLGSDSGPTRSAVQDAQAVCRQLGIAHHVVVLASAGVGTWVVSRAITWPILVLL